MFVVRLCLCDFVVDVVYWVCACSCLMVGCCFDIVVCVCCFLLVSRLWLWLLLLDVVDVVV